MGVHKKSDNLVQPFHQLILYIILYIRKFLAFHCFTCFHIHLAKTKQINFPS